MKLHQSHMQLLQLEQLLLTIMISKMMEELVLDLLGFNLLLNLQSLQQGES